MTAGPTVGSRWSWPSRSSLHAMMPRFMVPADQGWTLRRVPMKRPVHPVAFNDDDLGPRIAADHPGPIAGSRCNRPRHWYSSRIIVPVWLSRSMTAGWFAGLRRLEINCHIDPARTGTRHHSMLLRGNYGRSGYRAAFRASTSRAGLSTVPPSACRYGLPGCRLPSSDCRCRPSAAVRP